MFTLYLLVPSSHSTGLDSEHTARHIYTESSLVLQPCVFIVRSLSSSLCSLSNIHKSLSARALLSNRVKLEVYHEYLPSITIFIFASSSLKDYWSRSEYDFKVTPKQNSTRPLVSTLWLISKINSPSFDKILEFSCIIRASDRERPFSLLSLM